MSTKPNSKPKPSIADEAKSKIDDMVNSKPVKETKAKAKEAVNKVINTLQKSYEKTKESIDSINNQDAEQNLKGIVKSGKQKTSESGKKIKDSVIDTIDVFKEELESTESKEDINGKIQKSKKQLKDAKKNIKDRI
jgi:uncharacterized coiled-coil DUF342 family protein